jgi:hypothetical protein
VKPCAYSNTFFRFLFPILIFSIFPVSELCAQELPRDTLSRAFYDSLKIKAEKRRFTSLLYDMLIVSHSPAGSARENLTSTAPYDAYEGKIIRNRELVRLNAFGTNVDNPGEYDPSRSEKVMNSTYTKTKRFILNQYILFREGDTISPQEMADNERLLRQLPYIYDARITIVPVDSSHADVAVIVRENYPYGGNASFNELRAGMVKAFDRNFAGLGHELSLSMPYDFNEYSWPGFGINYSVRNIARTFSDLELGFTDGLGANCLKGQFDRDFVTSETKYAWSASLTMTRTTEDLDTMPAAVPLKFIRHDYWAARSFMLDRKSVTRLIAGGRYIHNNVFARPEIDDFSYYRLQNYQQWTGSLILTSQRFINTSLIYSYGRTEDIPYGYMIEMMGGREKNEFKWRSFAGIKVSYGNIFNRAGYIYSGISFSSFINERKTEQGVVNASLRYFTPLIHAGRSRIRIFFNGYYTGGFNRYTDEFLFIRNNDFVRGFRNDSIMGTERLTASIEPVLFLSKPLIGFRFALYAFADAGFLASDGFREGSYYVIPALGAGVRIRNDQLVLNTIQIRFAWYPNVPPWSESSWISATGVPRLRPPGFEPQPPGMIPFL